MSTLRPVVIRPYLCTSEDGRCRQRTLQVPDCKVGKRHRRTLQIPKSPFARPLLMPDTCCCRTSKLGDATGERYKFQNFPFARRERNHVAGRSVRRLVQTPKWEISQNQRGRLEKGVRTTHMNVHLKMPLNIHRTFPVTIHWESDNPFEHYHRQVTIRWKMPLKIHWKIPLEVHDDF